MKQDIKKLIISAVILSVGFFSIDNLVGYIGELALEKLPDFGNELCKINYCLNRVEADVIIIGSSRAHHHYNTKILADSVNNYLETNYSFYNAGINGQFVDGNSCMVESIIKRHTPQIIIFETNASGFRKDNFQKQLSKYKPFYKTNPAVREYLDKTGWKERLILKINMYRFNSKTTNFISCILHNNYLDNGYDPKYGIMNNSEIKTRDTSTPNTINDFSMNCFEKTISSCHNLNIKLIVASSPRFLPNNDNELIHSMCAKYNTPYIELYNTDFFNNHPELFYDKHHLNNDGAAIYTLMFFEKLKPYLEGL